MKRRMLAVLLILFVGICSVAHAADIPDATSNFFVNDFAGIFSDEDIRIMMEKAIDLDQNYDGIQVVVTTVKTIGNEALEVYANKMYNKYEIGKNNMGVLLLVVTEDRLIRAETGDMMQTYIPDSLMAKIMNESAIPYLRENKFAEGMVSFQDATINMIKQKVVVEVEDTSNAGLVATVAATKSPEISVETEPQTENTDTSFVRVSENSSKTENNNVFVILLVICAVAGLAAVIGILISTIKEKKKLQEFADNQVAKAKADVGKSVNEISQLREMLEASKTAAQSQESWIKFYKNGKEEADKEVERLAVQLNDARKENSSMKNELTSYREMIENVYELHPNIEDEISALLAKRKKEADMLAAESFDSFAAKRISLVSSIDNLDAFRNVIDKYQALTEEQKTYVKTDIGEINDKYEESVRLKKEEEARLAREAEMREAERLNRTIEQELASDIVPTMEQYDKLNGFMRNYNGMSVAAQAIFASGVIEAFNRRIEDTHSAAEEARRRREEEERRRREEEARRRREEEERRRREEEERRRRRREEEERRRRQRSMSSSSSSSRSRSSFGGFSGRGGRSSGGGASGRF